MSPIAGIAIVSFVCGALVGAIIVALTVPAMIARLYEID